ncbi:hypothetical protein A2U01_0069348, partial [Trifolium medium]|nr:hypothetical protein [Trifolium medium]
MSLPERTLMRYLAPSGPLVKLSFGGQLETSRQLRQQQQHHSHHHSQPHSRSNIKFHLTAP